MILKNHSSVMLGESSLSWCDSFTWKMVLKWPFISDMGGDCALPLLKSLNCVSRVLFRRWFWDGHSEEGTLHVHLWGLSGHRPLWVKRVLLRRWSWNGCSLVTLGNTLHILWNGLPGDRALRVGRVTFIRWPWNGQSFVPLEETLYSHCQFISCFWNVCVIVFNLKKYLYYSGNHMITLENGMKERTYLFYIMVLKADFCM